MKEECIFCKIIKGNIPSYQIYEDDYVKAFLDVNPTSNGHTLIIPKKHIENILDMDQETITHIFDTIQNKLYKELKEKLNCDGFTLVQNNEYSQEVKHFHIHLIPRYKNDSIKLTHDKNILKDIKEIYSILK